MAMQSPPSSNAAPVRRAVIFLGPPGSGKGTQSKELVKVLRVPHLSTGDMFRENIARRTPLGLAAKPLLERGELVPDDITLGMVEQRIAQPDAANGFVFDGFPRTLNQAERLNELLERRGFGKPAVLHIVVPEGLLLRRLTGRRVCSIGGEIYHIDEHPPKVPGRCDVDGGELIHRPDDREEVIRERLAEYERKTRPLAEYYRRQGALVDVDGARPLADVTRALLAALEQKPS